MHIWRNPQVRTNAVKTLMSLHGMLTTRFGAKLRRTGVCDAACFTCQSVQPERGPEAQSYGRFQRKPARYAIHAGVRALPVGRSRLSRHGAVEQPVAAMGTGQHL